MIAETAANPENWTNLVTAITGMLTALGILIHAVLSALRGQKLNAEVLNNTRLTQDVSGKADAAAKEAVVAAVHAAAAANKVDQVALMVNGAASRNEEQRAGLQVQVDELKTERSTQVLKDAIRQMREEDPADKSTPKP